MKKAVITCSLSGSFIIFGITSGFFDAALMFMLFGIIPGSEHTVSPATMLAGFMFLLGVTFSLNVQTIIRKTFTQSSHHPRQTA